jgi:hypothetical protein
MLTGEVKSERGRRRQGGRKEEQKRQDGVQ